MTDDAETKRITMKIETHVLEQLQEDAGVQRIPTGTYAGIIIKHHYNSDICSDIHDDSDKNELTEEIERLKSEIVELKKDKTWYQGEISQLHQNISLALPKPKKSLFWFLNKD